MHGQGRYRWADGREYYGDWNNNRRTGFGKLTYPDGKYYEGHYLNDLKEG